MAHKVVSWMRGPPPRHTTGGNGSGLLKKIVKTLNRFKGFVESLVMRKIIMITLYILLKNYKFCIFSWCLVVVLCNTRYLFIHLLY